jgi:hypothetical protein
MKDEEFCMQTDSHMDFVPDWDVHMIDMWMQTGNEYAVLSTYVADSATLKDNMPGAKGTNGVFEVPHLCMVTFSGGYGMVRNWGTKCMRNMPRPKLTNMVWGAGLSFSKCHAERKAPYDPHTPHIFDGEEFSRALRFWTWGYDIYSPHRVHVVHNYVESQVSRIGPCQPVPDLAYAWCMHMRKRRNANLSRCSLSVHMLNQSDPKHSDWAASKISWQQRNEEILASTTRLRMLMEMPLEPQFARGADGAIGSDGFSAAAVLAVQQSRFGLGDRRSLSQAIEFSGIDTRQRKMVGNKCGNLELVPFVEHPWGAAYVPAYDPASEAFADVRDPGSIYFNRSDASMRQAWDAANKLRQQSEQEGVHTLRVGATPASEPLARHNVPATAHSVDPLELTHHSVRRDVRDVTAREKMAVNLICLLLIVFIIAGRMLVLYRSKLHKTVDACMPWGATTDTAAKQV